MKEKFYVTTSIAYTNAPPHIGYALELVQADVIARYNKLLGKDVYFLTGTDEHGVKVARKAEEEGRSPKEFTDELSKKFQELTKVLNLSNSDFIRTTDKINHWPNVEKVWKQLEGQEDIYKKKYKGLYCVGCESFVKEKDLVDGKCPNHNQEPEVIEEENYFFKLSKYSDRVKSAIEGKKLRIIPDKRKNEIISFINQGVEDISISRSRDTLEWGIPVPGDDSQTIYIWFEALLNYLYPNKWPADVHCIGKDIFRFHALLWPAILLALNLPLPKNILVHGFIAVDGKKMSKSLGNVVDPFELVEKYGIDPVRYFLLREIPSAEDGDFTYEKFEDRYNADLANELGNLVSRVLALAVKFKVKKTEDQKKLGKTKRGQSLEISLIKTEKGIESSLKDFKFNEALSILWLWLSFFDEYIEDEKPWAGGKEKVIADLLFLLERVAQLLVPFLPETSEKILKQLKTGKSKALFPRI